MKIFTEHPHWTDVLEICTQLSKAGFRAYLAGGCVRDALMGNTPNDFDVATDALPDQVQELFPNSLDVGKAFGVIIIPFDAFQIEVATFRQDLDYKDGRRPSSVQFSSPEEDAKRRDFTVNALFYDWVDNKVLDFVGGVVDLESRILRCVGKPEERFKEDHLRIMRAIRFHAQLGFEIEEKTFLAIEKLASLTSDVSKERIREEMLKLLKSQARSEGIKLLQKTGVFEAVLPPLKKFLDSKYFVQTTETLAEPFHLTQEQNLWAALFLYLDKLSISVKSVLKELKCSNFIVSYVDKLTDAYWESLDAKAKPAVLLRLMAQFGHDLLEIHKIQSGVDASLSRWTELSQLPMELPTPLITSEDLKAVGIPEGPRFGQLLDDMFDLQLNGEITDRTSALAQLVQMADKK